MLDRLRAGGEGNSSAEAEGDVLRLNFSLAAGSYVTVLLTE